MNSADITKIRTAIEKFAELGVEVHITELAVRNYTNTEEMTQKHADFYEELFRTYLAINAEAKEAGQTGPITSISIWGLCDNPDLPETDYSYKMNGTYCGIFTELYAVKPAFLSVYNLLNAKNS